MSDEHQQTDGPSNEHADKLEKSKKSRKKSKNKKSGNPIHENEPAAATSLSGDNDAANQLTSLDKSQMEVLKTLKALKIAPPKDGTKVYKFWNTQPVPKIDESSAEVASSEFHKAIEPDKTIAEIRQDPYPLPEGFVWETMTLEDSQVLKELYTLLNENYVEDDDAMFRFDYQPEFLRWALQPPNWRKEWHVGVRVAKSGRLIAFISAIPAEIKVFDKHLKVVEINFLCVHKKLRSKRLAPVLIREITRRVNLTGIFQAVYTAGVVLPKPVTTCRYWHRSLNPRKLIEVS